jgi:hypothetical protein
MFTIVRTCVRFLPRLLLSGIAYTLTAGSFGCGGGENGPGPESDISVVQGGLGTFKGWKTIPGLTLFDSPALARAWNTTWTAFGRDNAGEIWATNQDGAGNWTGAWTHLPGGPFTSRPSAVALDLPSGIYSKMFAVAAMKSDGEYYLRIQDQTGNQVVTDWTQIVTSMKWASAPSIAYISPTANSTLMGSLVIAGLGSDGTIYMGATFLPGPAPDYRITVNNWGWGQIPGSASDSAPALASMYPSSQVTSDFVLVIGLEGDSGITYRYSKRGALNGIWSPWTDIVGNVFASGPAVAVGKSSLFGVEFRETTVYGIGFDSRVYVSKQPTSGTTGLTAIGTQAFGGNPSAVGFSNTAIVSALVNNATGATNTASSP